MQSPAIRRMLAYHGSIQAGAFPIFFAHAAMSRHGLPHAQIAIRSPLLSR